MESRDAQPRRPHREPGFPGFHVGRGRAAVPARVPRRRARARPARPAAVARSSRESSCPGGPGGPPHAYSKIWTREGSPLVATTERVRRALAAALGPGVPVHSAMRYGSPSIASAVAALAAQGCDEVLLIPQYPHYAMSSWETVVVRVYEEAARLAPRHARQLRPALLRGPGLHRGTPRRGLAAARGAARPPAVQLPRPSRAPPAQGRFVAGPLHGRGRLLHDMLARPRHVLQGAVRARRRRPSPAAQASIPRAIRCRSSRASRGSRGCEPFTDVEFVRLPKLGREAAPCHVPKFCRRLP